MALEAGAILFFVFVFLLNAHCNQYRFFIDAHVVISDSL